MAVGSKIRLFLDTNVLTAGLVSPWGLDKAVLSICAARVCKLLLAEVVQCELEENILLHADRRSIAEADKLIETYRGFIRLAKPELVAHPADALVRSNRHLIRHEADVPVLLSAMAIPRPVPLE